MKFLFRIRSTIFRIYSLNLAAALEFGFLVSSSKRVSIFGRISDSSFDWIGFSEEKRSSISFL